MKQILWYGCFPLQYEEQYEEINLVRLVSFNKTVFLRNHWFTTFPTFNWRQFFVTWWKKKAHSSLDELQQPWENQSVWEYMYVPPGNTWCHWSVSLLEFLVFLYQKWCWYKNPDWEYHSRFHQTKSHHLGPGSLWSWTLQRTSKNKQRRKTFFVWFMCGILLAATTETNAGVFLVAEPNCPSLLQSIQSSQICHTHSNTRKMNIVSYLLSLLACEKQKQRSAFTFILINLKQKAVCFLLQVYDCFAIRGFPSDCTPTLPNSPSRANARAPCS